MATEPSTSQTATVAAPNRPTAPGAAMAREWAATLPKLGAAEDIAPATPPAEPVVEEPIVPPIETPKPTPPKPEAPKEPVKAPEPENKMPRSAKDWDAYKAAEKKRLAAKDEELAKVQARIAELDKELSTAKTAVPANADEALKKELADYSERLRILDIQNHPKFKAYYDGKITSQIELAKRIVGADNASQLAELLQLPDSQYRQSQIESLIEGLTPIQQSRIGGVLNSLAEIEVDKQNQITQAKSDFERIQGESKAKAEKQRQELASAQEALFNEELAAQRKSDFMFQPREGDDQWNGDVTNREAFAKRLMFGGEGVTPNMLAKAAFYAASYPAVLKFAKEQTELVSKLEQQVKDMTASTPRLTTAAPESVSAPAPKRNKNYLGGLQDASQFIKELNTEVAVEE